MTVLVTGGAGYIGSVVVDALAERSERVVVVDNLSRSSLPALPRGVTFESASVGDIEAISRLVIEHGITSCIHLAGLISVGESVRDPGTYIENNVVQSARLIRALIDGGVKFVVFSLVCRGVRKRVDSADHRERSASADESLWLDKALRRADAAHA